MITFDFEYHKPSSVEEALSTFQSLHSDQKEVFYYGGGTEFISRARMNELKADAIIDLKGIPACKELKIDGDKIVIGAAATLTNIAEANIFPLLSNVSRLIATHTERNKITIGGNIASHLYYKEAIMPFLLADSEVVIAREDGIQNIYLNEIYQNELQLKQGEFIVQILTDSTFSQFPHFNSKKTKQSKVNYPIVSLASLKVDNQIRIAFSGLCAYPFRLEQIDLELNDTSHSIDTRIKNVMKLVPTPVLDDLYASADYRKFVLKHALMEMLEKMEGVSS